MKIKTVSATYGRKFNLGDFNSLEISMTVWADIAEDEDEQAAISECWKIAKDHVKEQALPVIKQTKQAAKELLTVAGIPVEK
jgi:hypothetical protein